MFWNSLARPISVDSARQRTLKSHRRNEKEAWRTINKFIKKQSAKGQAKMMFKTNDSAVGRKVGDTLTRIGYKVEVTDSRISTYAMSLVIAWPDDYASALDDSVGN